MKMHILPSKRTRVPLLLGDCAQQMSTEQLSAMLAQVTPRARAELVALTSLGAVSAGIEEQETEKEQRPQKTR